MARMPRNGRIPEAARRVNLRSTLGDFALVVDVVPKLWKHSLVCLICGREDILKSVDLTIYMGNSSGDCLSDTEKADIHKPRPISRKNGNEQNDWIKNEFPGFFNDEDETWHVDCGDTPPEIFKAKMLMDVVAYYKTRSFTREVCAKMLGISDNTLRDKLKATQELLEGKNIK